MKICYNMCKMQRPGNINGYQGYSPRTQNARQANFSGLSGTFGKGYYFPPPAPPPKKAAAPAKYIGGKWVCEGDTPPQEADGYYHCCPSGWNKTKFEVTRPCGKDYGQTICGPLPEGATIDDGVCCESMKEWMPNTEDGSDPCKQAALDSGRAVPGYMDTMLAPELVVDRGPLVSPVIMMAGGLAVAALFIVTIILKLKS
jgi:hypothetical protein